MNRVTGHTRPVHRTGTALLASALAALALASAPLPAQPAAAATEIRVLQLNLCHSGLSTVCYASPPTRVIDKAIEVIQSVKPHVLSLNEICTSDLDRLRGAMERTAPEHVEFKAAEKPPGTKRMCTDGRGEYGNAVMVSDEYAGSDHSSGIYTAQVTGEEQRVYSCLGGGRINACTTHLTVDGEGKALEQCGELMSGPASRYANSGPTIVAGDLNLRYNRHDKYHNVQKCVPDGFVRKGDEKVQHVMASSRFDFIDKRNVSMKDGKGQTTDHPALLATLVLR